MGKTVTRDTNSRSFSGWLNGLLGVMIFSGSLPATRVAVLTIDPLFLTFTRASVAGVLAIILIFTFRNTRPNTSQIMSLVIVSLGVVVGFPLLTAMALQHITSGHSIVFLGLLPLVTALFGIMRGCERPGRAFWVFSLAGSFLVIGFALSQDIPVSLKGYLLMLAAVLLSGMGYAEGAKLTRVLGGWQVISWALIISLPAMLVGTFLTMPVAVSEIPPSAWIALGYVSIFSMLIGFMFWYKGLATGGIAYVGQLQLLQPLFGLALSAVLLHEPASPWMVSITLGVLLCVVGSRKFSR